MRKQIDDRISVGLGASYVEKSDDVIEETKRQLDEYFSYQRKIFSIPLLTIGTEFQKKVWNGLQKISYGETSSYKELAQDIGNLNAIRAVGSANGANAISIIIPCHRIIGTNGGLGGYAGGLQAKEKLLRLENDLFS